MPNRLLPLVGAMVLLTGSSAAQAVQHQLMPVPAEVRMSDARFRLDSTVTVAITDYRDARLERAVNRAMRRLEKTIAAPLPRSFGSSATTGIIISVDGPGFATPDISENEAYHLSVTPERVIIHGYTVVGAMRGLETLLQLYGADRDGHYLAGTTIADEPRFPWRGLNLDVSRHFHDVGVVKRTLDGMAAVKLNVLHWHLADDQGFRVESRRFPLLHQLGSDGDYFTQDQIREVVEYATDRGIRVVPEFDMPGHTTAWLVGYPELGSAPGPYSIERAWGVHKPTIDPTRESVYGFLDAFIAEMVQLFPDRYWHVGGDEVDPAHWRQSEFIQNWMKENGIADTHALQAHFNTRLFAILDRYGRRPVGWDEIMNPGLPKTAVIQSWRGTSYLVEAAKNGQQAFLSAPYYLDHIKTAEEMYLSDPLPTGHGLTAEQQRLVLGGEACMWAEYVTSEMVDSRIWPRLAAIAERFWSPESVKDVDDMYRRLEVMSVRLATLGLGHEDHRARMVRHFATGADAAVLLEFLEYARPKGFGWYGADQFTPLNRLQDVAIPEPWNRWRLRALARSAIAGDGAARSALAGSFERMTRFESELETLRSRVPLAGEGVAAARALGELGRLGEDALGRVVGGNQADAGWRAAADSTLSRIHDRRFGLIRVVGTEAVRALVEAVPR